MALLLVALAAFALAGAEAWARGGHGGGHGGGSGHSGGRSGFHHSRSAHGFHGSGSTAYYGTFLAGPVYWLGEPYPPAEPVHYIERSEEELKTDSAWFYCENDAAYYPYVTNCPGGWVKVAPFALP